MAYEAQFTGASSTDLADYTSDSSHTHTKQSGSGSLQLTGGGELYAVTSDQGAFYTASYTPADPHYRLSVTFIVSDLQPIVIAAGMRCETDGDGVFIQTNGFDDTFDLLQVVGGSETVLDTVAMTVGTHTLEVEIDGDDGYEWFLNSGSQGTGTISSSLSAAGLIGYSKYSATGANNNGQRITAVSVTEIGGGGGDETGPDCYVMTSGGLVACTSRAMTSGGLFPPVE